jgi:hypothetical protein
LARAGYLLAAVVTILCPLISPGSAHASTVPPGFPRIAVWWPASDTQSLALRARCDWTALPNHDGDHIAELRAANPSIFILGTTNARELYCDLTDYDAAFNVEVRSASTDWMLTQLGSTLAADVDATATTIPLADTSRFRAGEMVLAGDELLHVESVGAFSLTVARRGPVNPPSSHPAGTRIAPVVSSWSGSITMDLSTDCPRRDVGYGPETWAEWNLRRARGIMGSADWDGLLIDCLEGNPRWIVALGFARSFDPHRTNTPVADDYVEFNAAWNEGATVYGDSLRAAFPDGVLVGNGNLRNYAHNGTVFEAFPRAGMSQDYWDMIFTGVCVNPWASYPEWCTAAASPNLTLVQTYGTSADYRMMRFGLCSTLLSDGYYTYALSGEGHARNGIWWYDEYDNAGAGRWYLGLPTGPARKVGTAWRRDFDGGVALVNPTSDAVTVTLGGAFRKIKGKQDPIVNSGATVTSVRIPAHDGLIVLRIPTVALSASRTLLRHGLETTLQVKLAPATAGDVRIDCRPVGSALWKPMATAPMGSGGSARFVCAPTVSTDYRAVFVKAGVTSRSVRVGARPNATIRASRASARAGSSITVSGTVSRSGHTRLALQRLVGGRWTTARRLVTSHDGSYVTIVSLRTRGVFAYRVYVAADAGHLATTSGVIRIAFR